MSHQVISRQRVFFNKAGNPLFPPLCLPQRTAVPEAELSLQGDFPELSASYFLLPLPLSFSTALAGSPGCSSEKAGYPLTLPAPPVYIYIPSCCFEPNNPFLSLSWRGHLSPHCLGFAKTSEKPPPPLFFLPDGVFLNSVVEILDWN